jgi:type IX secretion system PorP/SprF family membrane protein
MAGYDGYTSVNTTGRQQWVGFGDAPQTFSASWQTRLLAQSYRIVENPVRNKKMLLPSTNGRVGLGAYIINDANGYVSRTGVQFTYAYHLIINHNQLSFGLAGKVFQYRIDKEDLTFGGEDPLQTAGIRDVGYTPDVDFGMYWTNTVYFVGASVNNLLQSAVNIGGDTYDYKITRHYWIMGGYKFFALNDFSYEPNILLKTTEQWLPQADIGVKMYYINEYWTGLAYRTDKSLLVQFGMRSNALFIGYAFDYSFSSIQRFSYGSHEVSISYKFGDNARRYRWLRRY